MKMSLTKPTEQGEIFYTCVVEDDVHPVVTLTPPENALCLIHPCSTASLDHHCWHFAVLTKTDKALHS